MIETTNNCPTCGSAVEIHSGDDGTHCYLEITTEQSMRIKALEAELKEIFLETCWYCDSCYKPMAEDDDGYTRHKIGFCSEECADDYDAAR